MKYKIEQKMAKVNGKESINFRLVSKAIYEHFDDHANGASNLIELKPDSLADYNDGLRKELLSRHRANNEAVQMKQQPTTTTLDEFTTLFKTLDQYPQNLQKPKRKELFVRTSSNKRIGVDSTIVFNKDDEPENTRMEVSVPTKLPEVINTRLASEIFKDFQEFRTKLKEYHKKLNLHKDLSAEHNHKMSELKKFIYELEKLYNNHSAPESLFNPEEEDKLKMIAKNLKDISLVAANENVFDTEEVEFANAEWKSIVDVLSFTLRCVESFDTEPTATSLDSHLMGPDIFDD